MMISIRNIQCYRLPIFFEIQIPTQRLALNFHISSNGNVSDLISSDSTYHIVWWGMYLESKLSLHNPVCQVFLSSRSKLIGVNVLLVSLHVGFFVQF
jgi:hypothetical protein